MKESTPKFIAEGVRAHTVLPDARQWLYAAAHHRVPPPPPTREQAAALERELKQLRHLIAQGAAVVDDLLTSTGPRIICQDYGRMNDFLIAARKVGRTP